MVFCGKRYKPRHLGDFQSTCFRKKKKKKTKAEEVIDTVEKVEAKVSKESDKRTPAQIAYDKVQEQRVNFTMGAKYLCVST